METEHSLVNFEMFYLIACCMPNWSFMRARTIWEMSATGTSLYNSNGRSAAGLELSCWTQWKVLRVADAISSGSLSILKKRWMFMAIRGGSIEQCHCWTWNFSGGEYCWLICAFLSGCPHVSQLWRDYWYAHQVIGVVAHYNIPIYVVKTDKLSKESFCKLHVRSRTVIEIGVGFTAGL